MSVRLKAAAVCLVLVSCGASARADTPRGFEALFNGKDLTGWHARPHFDPRKLAAMKDAQRKQQIADWWTQAKEHWRVDEGEVVNDGKGPYLTSDREFGDFELLLEYKTVAKADSGIYLRGNPQVQIWDSTKAGGKWNRGADKGSGGLFNNGKRVPGQEPSALADRPFGQWNQFRIRQVGARTDVWLNGKHVVKHALMENFWDRSRPQFRTGPIQLQTHGGEIRWRNLFIRELPADEANQVLNTDDGFETIFNGKNFDGWQGDLGSYQVVDGAILCKAGQGGNLFTKDEYADFVVRLEFKLPPGGNNGLAIRYPGEGRPHLDAMCELQVLDNTHPKYAKLDPRQFHGSAYGMIPAQRGYLRPLGEWNYQQVTVRGSRIEVELNGFLILDGDLSKVTEFKDGSPHPGKDRQSGYFGFAGHNDPVAFRNVQIKRLDPADAKSAGRWPQFRGQNSSGLATSPAALPTKIGPDESVVWKVALPPGHSSPVVFDDRIYVSGVRDRQLVTMALDRATGKTLWERVAPHTRLEKIHRIGSLAQCSPATDGQLIVSLFGSNGVFCYDRDGKELWNVPLGPFNNDFGAGTSPVIVDDRVIIVQDHDTDSYLTALDKRTGKTIWKTDRSEFPRNYCSPVIWNVDGRKQVVIAATLRAVGYDLESGKELWTVRGLSRTVCVTPVVGEDNVLYLAGWAQGGDAGARISIPHFPEALSTWDKNKNGTLENEELVKGGNIQRRFNLFDSDKSGAITKREYVFYRNLFETAQNVVLAIRPGGVGDVSKSHVKWTFHEYLPFCASPLQAHGYVYTVKDGGIVTSRSAITGEPIKTGRVPGTANYYASPVAGDNKVYLVDQRGRLSVLSSYAEWKVLADADFEEDVYATPALVDGRIYLRTSGHLYCLGGQ